MRIVYVNPGSASSTYGNVSYNVGIEPPYWAVLRASIARQKGNEVKVIDAEVDNLSPIETVREACQYKPDVVEVIALGITPSCSSTPKMVVATEVLRGIKEVLPRAMRFITGIHPAALAERTVREVPAIPINGCPEGDPTEWPVPAWDLLPMEKYRAHQWHCWGGFQRIPYASLYSSFGCPYNCSFCTIHSLYNWPTIKYHTVERVMKEIDILHNKYGITNIKFADELFTTNKRRVLAICKGLKERNYERNYHLNLWGYSHIGTIDREIVEAMLEAGFRWQCFGIESSSERVRHSISKKFSTDKLRETLNMVRQEGAYLNGDFIFGLPEDDIQSMRETLNFAKEYLFEFVNFNVAMAYPGSHLYSQLRDRSCLPKTWDAYSQYSPNIIPLPTKYLTSKEVLQFRDDAFIEYHNNPDYLAMMKKKFGIDTVNQIKELLSHHLERNLLRQP